MSIILTLASVYLQSQAAGKAADGSAASIAATVEGARTQSNIEEMNRAFMRENFEKELALQKPFYEAGKKALPLYQMAINNKLDVEKMPLYQAQKGMIEKSFAADTPEYIKERAFKALGAQEGELAKTRLADIQQIGLGQAGSAGQSVVGLGSALAGSLSRGSGALAQGTASASMQTANMWTKTAEDLSGIPAFVASQWK